MGKRHPRDRQPGIRPIVAALVAIGVLPSAAYAQFGASNHFSLTEAQVDAIDSAVEGELAAIEALLSGEHWDEGVERLRALAETSDRRVVLVDDGAGLYISLRQYCQRLLCRLPGPALALYRGRVDSLAESWYHQAVEQRDEELLQQVVQHAFASSFGDDALYALGELALERGDYSAARRAWERITPLAREREGRPLWIALEGIDIRSKWNELEPLLAAANELPQGLIYPDTDLEPAEVLARLVLGSIRERALQRAETELAVLQGLFPDARGKWGGKDVVLAAALQDMLEEARTEPPRPSTADWPTFAGSADRNGRAPDVPDDLSHLAWRADLLEEDRVDRRVSRVRSAVRSGASDADDPLSIHPVLASDKLLYNDRNRLYALQLATGKSAVPGRTDGVLYAPEREPSRGALQPGRGHIGVPHHTLTVANDTVLARTGSAVTIRAEASRLAGDEGLVGLELDGGRLQLRIEPESDRWAFEGTPLVAGDRVLVALRQSDVRPRAIVACYSRTSGGLLWQTFVAAADTPARPGWEEISHNLLTLAGDTVYYNTNLGVIAALGVHDGTIRWIKRYDRAQEGDLSQLDGHFQRDLTPCIYHQGVLYCAPSDTPFLFALDAVTGQTLWRSGLAENVVHLLGVANGRLIASGERLWWFHATNGKVMARWPEGEGSGVHGYGRGVIAGDAVLWPTREQRIFVFDLTAAEQVRQAIDLRPFDVSGGNLVVAGDYLVIAGADEIAALGPPAPAGEKEEDTAEVAVVQ